MRLDPHAGGEGADDGSQYYSCDSDVFYKDQRGNQVYQGFVYRHISVLPIEALGIFEGLSSAPHAGEIDFHYDEQDYGLAEQEAFSKPYVVDKGVHQIEQAAAGKHVHPEVDEQCLEESLFLSIHGFIYRQISYAGGDSLKKFVDEHRHRIGDGIIIGIYSHAGKPDEL